MEQTRADIMLKVSPGSRPPAFVERRVTGLEQAAKGVECRRGLGPGLR